MLALLALSAAAAPATSPVTLLGVGDLRIGMSVSELRRLGARKDYDPEDDPACSFWSLPKRKGIAVMVSYGQVVRIDIENPQYVTASGARVGMSESQVRRIYGDMLKVEPHPYTSPEGHYLVYRASDRRHGMIFETFRRKVHSFRVGRWNHVQLIEGCS
ncbi:MAG TPA: hypothetical protein VM308_02505 [Sphingomicrobium sp.]|nr:hypothetical protein [Sphingomicrobium sp.]